MRAKRALVELRAMEAERVSFDVKDAALHVALTVLFEGTGQSLILDPTISEADQSVTLSFNDVPLESAVKVICKLYNLDYETDGEGLWVIMPSSAVATIGGERVRVLGAAPAVAPTTRLQSGRGGPYSVLRQPGGESILRVHYSGNPPHEVREWPTDLARFGLSDLVDLKVENAPLGEVAEKLGVKLDGVWRVQILVHEAVPKDIEVTAKVYRMRRDHLVLMLAEQADLDISIDSQRTPESPHTRVYFVPRPEMRVSGTGDEMTIIGRYLQSGSSGTALSRAEDARRMAEEVERRIVLSRASGTEVGVLRSCPKCDASILLRDWEYCPYCGAEAPAAEEQPEGAD
jgi:hypothetical protein